MTVKEQINHDILEVAQTQGKDPKTLVIEYADYLPPSFDFQCDGDVPVIVKAWTSLQIEQGSPLRYIKSRKLGEFIYNTNMYKYSKYSGGLRYISDSGLTPILPDGLFSCNQMFAHVKLQEGFTLGDNFDTSGITCMDNMFFECKLPAGFILSDKFDTSKVTSMKSMFDNCKFPEGFTLGDKFDTSKVTNMEYMFNACEFQEGFTLGDKFDTSRVTDMSCMFDNCKFPEGFTLGNKFNTAKVKNMSFMFAHCKFPKDFAFGAKFNTSRVTDMSCMFCCSEFPSNVNFEINLNTLNVLDMNEMFAECNFPEDLTFGHSFSVDSVQKTSYMFEDAKRGGKPLHGSPADIIKSMCPDAISHTTPDAITQSTPGAAHTITIEVNERGCYRVLTINGERKLNIFPDFNKGQPTQLQAKTGDTIALRLGSGECWHHIITKRGDSYKESLVETEYATFIMPDMDIALRLNVDDYPDQGCIEVSKGHVEFIGAHEV